MELMEVENKNVQSKDTNNHSDNLSYPSDWDWINLGETSLLKARIGWQGLTTAEYLNTGDYLLVTGTDFLNGFIDWENCFYVEAERYNQDKNIQLKTSDVLVTKDGTIGKVAFVNKVVKPATLNSGVFVIRPKQDAYDPQYLYYVLRSNHFEDFLSKLTAGSTISHLYQKDFIHYSFPAPPTLTEQKAIATTLSNVDALISNLDNLIAKKKAIKQGAMQQLLKSPKQGGIRLPGFEGEWEEKRIGDVCQIFGRIGFRGYTVDDIVEEGKGAITISPSNISDGKTDFKKATYISWFKYEESPEIQIENNDILLVKTGSTVGKTALVKSLKHKATINPQIVVLKRTKCDNRLLSYLMSSKIVQDQIITCVVGGAIPTLSQKQILNFGITMPPTLTEQEAIATILSDMDTEIENLEKKKAKYLSIKQGMMQELLTGKTRLV
jgi:type I restriction enzyme, S subunit